MQANRSIPSVTVIPTLAYPDVGAAADWLCATFGFSVRLRIATHRIQLNVGDGAVVLTELQGDAEAIGQSHGVLVRVADAQAHHDRAKAHGASIVQAPADQPYGERQYIVADLAGRRWTFSQSITDVAPESWGGVSENL